MQFKNDACTYYLISETLIIDVLYVDDAIICCNNCLKMNDLLSNFNWAFKMKYLEIKYFVGIQIERNRKLRTLKVFQKAMQKNY